jgi:hypothetical protein
VDVGADVVIVVVVDAAAVVDVRSHHHDVESGSFFELTASSLHSESTLISEINLKFGL